MTLSTLFDVSGKSALIAGASGAFGAVAARTLAEAGCSLTLASGNAEALDAIASECRELGAASVTVNARPDTETAVEAIVGKAVEAHGRLDILVVASGMNKVAKIEDMAPDTFLEIMDANVTQSWLLARAASAQMRAQGGGGKIILVSSARGFSATLRATPPTARQRRRSTGSPRPWAASSAPRGSPSTPLRPPSSARR